MPDELSELAKHLASDEPAEREDSAQRLAQSGDQRAAPFLLHALDDDAEMVRMWAAYGLGLLRRREDLKVLKKAMAEDDPPPGRLWAAFGAVTPGERPNPGPPLAFL